MPDPLWLTSTVASDDRRVQLATFRDGRGEPVDRWPTKLIPSTTLIIWHPTRPGTVFCHQRSDNGWWGFVGGGQQIGESILDCARREAREETGWDIAVKQLICIDSDPAQGALCCYPDGNCVQYLNLTFTAFLLQPHRHDCPTLSDESTSWGWFPVEYLPPHFLPTHRWRLDQIVYRSPVILPVR